MELKKRHFITCTDEYEEQLDCYIKYHKQVSVTHLIEI